MMLGYLTLIKISCRFLTKTKNLLLDVGWYPEGDPTGSYGIELIKNEDWANPIEDIMCSELKDLITQLDHIFMKEMKNEY